VRRLPAAVAALGLVAVALAGCSSSPASSCERTTQSGGIEDLVSVSGDVGTEPDVDVPLPFRVDELKIADLETGDGTRLVEQNQMFAMGLTIIDGTTGDVLADQGYDDESQPYALSQWTETIPGFGEALECATEGSRIVIGLPGAELGAGAEQLGLTEGSDAVAVIDLRKVYLPAADGAEQFNEGRGLPSVVRAPNGQPGIIVPDAEAPAEVVVQVLKRGDGPKLEDGDSARVAFTTVEWNTPGEVAGTSWGSPPQAVPIAEGQDPVIDALRGQTVGSQVMVVVPSGGDETDEEPNASIYVFDILGIDETAAG
jgi:peptidylprolyl isomerase